MRKNGASRTAAAAAVGRTTAAVRTVASILLLVCTATLLLLQPTPVHGQATDEKCAALDDRSMECGAGKNSGNPPTCCPGFKCSNKDDRKCVVDRKYVPPEPTSTTTTLDTTETPVATPTTTVPEYAGFGHGSDRQDGDFADDQNGEASSPPPPPAGPPAQQQLPPTATIDVKDLSLVVDPLFKRQSRRWQDVLVPPEPSRDINGTIIEAQQASSQTILSRLYEIDLVDPNQIIIGSDGSESNSVGAERDPFFFSAEPSSAPSSSPSLTPTLHHSSMPSQNPTEAFMTEPEPDRMSDSYFDYRPNGKRGPDNWDRVDDPPESDYWSSDFNQYIAPSLRSNRCGDYKSDRQSPIDLRLDDAKGQCFEYHEIRHKPGIYNLDDDKVDVQILPSKLRVRYPRNFGSEAWGGATTNDLVKGPSADIPKGWGHQLPVTHVDIKIPSEHYMEGKQYAAEYQINLIQNRDAQRGAPVIGVLFDLHPNNTANFKLQQLLDAFQAKWDRDEEECEDGRRRGRRLDALLTKGGGGGSTTETTSSGGGTSTSTWLDEPPEEEIKFQRNLRKVRREAQQYRKYDIWNDEVMTTTWFFGYEGSLTEPPCTEFVEWRIMDRPALISSEQLYQMKKLLFHHVHPRTCARTSVHYEASVARPLQRYNGRYVHRCMCRDFIGDDDRKWYGENRCRWVEREEWGFPRDVFTQEWYDRTHKYEDPSDQPKGTWQS